MDGNTEMDKLGNKGFRLVLSRMNERFTTGVNVLACFPPHTTGAVMVNGVTAEQQPSVFQMCRRSPAIEEVIIQPRPSGGSAPVGP